MSHVNQSLQATNLADILERVLDKGIVIAGDISISLVDIELLTIRLRLLIASVDKAKEMGIDWWEADPTLSTRAIRATELEQENRVLLERLERLEARVGAAAGATERKRTAQRARRLRNRWKGYFAWPRRRRAMWDAGLSACTP